jgi:GTP cyclohydrolase IA
MPVDRTAAEAAIVAFLRAIGRDPDREGELEETGARVAAAYIDEICDGYGVDTTELVARNVIAGSTELVVLRDMAVTTMCPHHLMPAVGTATVAFAPGEALLGLGAIPKLVDAFAHRLTLQEQIGERVVGALLEELRPRWVGCRLLLDQMCVTARGERKHGTRTETVAFGGDVSPEERLGALSILGVGTSAGGMAGAHR